MQLWALNGAFLADHAGQTAGEPDWDAAADNLLKFWENRITNFSDIGKVRKKFLVIAKVIGGGFNGLLKMKRLDRLVAELLDVKNIAKSKAPVFPGIVELNNGEFFYATANKDWAQKRGENNVEIRFIGKDFLDYVLASTREPVKMPIVIKAKKSLVDGGVRNIAPLKSAIQAGAEEIITIACQPEKSSLQTRKSYRNFFTLADRTVGIMTNEIVNNDLQLAQKINLACLEYGDKTLRFKVKEGPFKDYRYVESTIIRPDTSLGINVLKFNSKQIKEMIEKGKAQAKEALIGREDERKKIKELIV